MTYSVKEIFYTLQGEGVNAGRPAVFCRFSGCNLWSGHEADRSQATCPFCDTDFVGINGLNGGRFASAAELAKVIAEQWPRYTSSEPFVVCTGGEPLLQLDATLVRSFPSAASRLLSRPTEPAYPRTASTGSVSVRRPVRRCAWPGRRAQAGLSASGRRARSAYEEARLRPFPAAADGRAGVAAKHRSGDRLLPRASTLAAEPADTQVPRRPVIRLRERPSRSVPPRAGGSTMSLSPPPPRLRRIAAEKADRIEIRLAADQHQVIVAGSGDADERLWLSGRSFVKRFAVGDRNDPVPLAMNDQRRQLSARHLLEITEAVHDARRRLRAAENRFSR